MRKLKYFLMGRLFPCLLVLLLSVSIALLCAVRLPPVFTAGWAIERVFSLCVACAVIPSHELADVRFSRLLFIFLLPWVGAIYCLVKTLTKSTAETARFQPPYRDELLNRFARATNGSDMRAGYAREAELFTVGKQILPRLLSDLSHAQKFIYLEFYLIDEGLFRDAVFSVLEKRAKAGVDVRILYDDWGCAFTLSKHFAKHLKSLNIRAYPMQKLLPLSPSRLNCRDHRKCVIVDGDIAYTGGMNLADEYVGERVKYGHWKDGAVRLCGTVAGEFARGFERQWKRACKREEPNEICVKKGEEKIPCIPFGVQPHEGQDGAYYKLLLTVLARTDKRVYFTTPYLVPDERLYFALVQAAQGGADVRVLIPHLPDKRTVFLLTRAYARRLEKEGVRVREYEAGFLHAKNVVADGKYVVVSSSNLDLRSLRLQYECGVLVAHERLAERAEKDFLNCWEQSVATPSVKWWERVLTALLRPFAHLT